MKLAILTIFLMGIISIASGWKADPPYYGQIYADLGAVRVLNVDPSGDLLALNRREKTVAVIYDQENGDGTINAVNQVVITNPSGYNINHGMTYHEGYIYAASLTAVYRWPYTPGSRTQVNQAGETVVNQIPDGGHDTRTIIFDSQNRLYITIGAGGNIDRDSSRARVRRFALQGLLPIPFEVGEVFADGMRNTVGLGFDSNGVLFGVDAGPDNLQLPEFGNDIYNTNPAEEMNKFNRPVGTHYGYPYCFGSYKLLDFPKGTQFAWPLGGNEQKTNEWCQDVTNNEVPAHNFPSHSSPLGIEFYEGQGCGVDGGFPCSWTGDALVAFHGSWNSNEDTGYNVLMIPFANGNPTGEEVQVVYDSRYVNAVFNHKGHLLVSSDNHSIILRLTYGQPPPTIRNYIVENATGTHVY